MGIYARESDHSSGGLAVHYTSKKLNQCVYHIFQCVFFCKVENEKGGRCHDGICLCQDTTDRQTTENQRYEISRFCEANDLMISKWIEECISGEKSAQERKLGKLLKRMKKHDILICSELSRLGRNLLMIMSILNECMMRHIKVWTIKDNYRLGNDISCKVLAFAFSLSAEIERSLISERTKEALARKKAEGIKLGRPVGSKAQTKKLHGKELSILKLLNANTPKTRIAKKLKVRRQTLYTFIKDMGLQM
jgi:DNA invertase Pin-like site-specific DNA recombinase